LAVLDYCDGMRRLTWLVIPTTIAFSFSFGCSSSDNSGDHVFASQAEPDGGDGTGMGAGGADNGSSSGGGSFGAASSGGSAAGGASSGGGASGAANGGGAATTGSGGAFPWIDFSYTPPPTPDAGACAATTLQAQQVEVVTEVQVPVQVAVEVPYEVTVDVVVNEPAAFYVMLDKSGSMDDAQCTSCGFLCQQCDPTKWEYAVSAISTFVNDPGSAGLSVALQYFSIGGGQCDGTGYDTPAVALADLPGNATAITTSLGANSPNGGTPTEGALNGLRKFCQSFNVSNPGEPCVGVLVTDGDPADCNTDPTVLAGIADAMYQTDGNQLFTVGMNGATFSFLNDVAIKGGTDCTPNVAGGEACNATDDATFLAALQGIVGQVVTQTTVTETRTEYQTQYETQYVTETQSQSIPCEYTIPTPDSGIIDPTQIQVVFSAGSNKQYIPPAGSEAQCGDGWYFDDPVSPTKVQFCPTTCSVLEAIPGGRVDLEFGCLGS
jgi:hypothetical protein